MLKGVVARRTTCPSATARFLWRFAIAYTERSTTGSAERTGINNRLRLASSIVYIRTRGKGIEAGSSGEKSFDRRNRHGWRRVKYLDSITRNSYASSVVAVVSRSDTRPKL